LIEEGGPLDNIKIILTPLTVLKFFSKTFKGYYNTPECGDYLSLLLIRAEYRETDSDMGNGILRIFGWLVDGFI